VSMGVGNWSFDFPLKRKPFEFELGDMNKHVDWFEVNYYRILGFGALYFAFVMGGQRFMKNRPPFDLKPALAVWNLCLGIFSAIGFARLFPDFADIWWSSDDGPYQYVCVR